MENAGTASTDLPRASVKPKLSDVVASDLTAMILARGLKPGVRLPSEKDMMAQLRVGRPALREALRLLEARGIVRMQTGRNGGPVVMEPDTRAVSESLSLLLVFRGATVADVLSAREVIEPAVAAEAARNRTEENVAELERSAQAVLLAPSDHAILTSEQSTFHGKLSSMSGSLVLSIVLDAAKRVISTVDYESGYSTNRRKQIAAEHQEIAAAIRKHDPNAAEEAMRRHLNGVRVYWDEVRPGFLNEPMHLLPPAMLADALPHSC